LSNGVFSFSCHHHVSKKDFCRLLKTAHLMTLEEIQKSWYH